MKVAVIGAGISGLACVKICRDYGLDVVCFEKADDIGGLWYYRSEPKLGLTTVMKSTIINTSKEFMCYSDFPMPDDFPNYVHHTKFMEYCKMYLEHFKIVPFIKFNIEVNFVERGADFKQTGRWKLKVTDLKTNIMSEEIFDGVFLANGHHSDPFIPHFVGEDQFKGQILHAQLYKDDQGYEGKRVVVVGAGNSGTDIAVELSRTASQVYLVTRSGSWCLNRVAAWGLPSDSIIFTRAWFCIFNHAPIIPNTLLEAYADHRFNHKLYNVFCKHHIFEQHPTVNDDLAHCITCGAIIMKRCNIKQLYENAVEFSDGYKAENIDTIFLATGYNIAFPFLEPGIIDIDPIDNKVHNLYKNIFPAELEHQTLFVIGLAQPWGPLLPVSEMQARVCCQILLKTAHLPPTLKLIAQMRKDNSMVYSMYTKSRRHSVQIVYVKYMDTLANMIGVKPKIWKYLFTDFWLSFHLAFSPCSPYQYRLEGPHQWAGARKTQLTIWRRILNPLRADGGPNLQEKGKLGGILHVVLSLYLVFIIFWSYVLWHKWDYY